MSEYVNASHGTTTTPVYLQDNDYYSDEWTTIVSRDGWVGRSTVYPYRWQRTFPAEQKRQVPRLHLGDGRDAALRGARPADVRKRGAEGGVDHVLVEITCAAGGCTSRQPFLFHCSSLVVHVAHVLHVFRPDALHQRVPTGVPCIADDHIRLDAVAVVEAHVACSCETRNAASFHALSRDERLHKGLVLGDPLEHTCTFEDAEEVQCEFDVSLYKKK